MILKADLHSHTNLDPMDGPSARKVVVYSVSDALMAAKLKGIDVISFTHHNKLIYTSAMKKEAEKRGILLIPGFEATIEGSHVVLLNPTTDKITTFKQLAAERRRNKSLFVFAPHPFYPGASSLGFSLLRNIHLFDGVEYCHFHTSWFNLFNWLAVAVAKENNKSIVGTSDAHSLIGFGMTYAIVDAKKKTVRSVIDALKSSKSVRLYTTNASFSYLCKVLSNVSRSIQYFVGNK